MQQNMDTCLSNFFVCVCGFDMKTLKTSWSLKAYSESCQSSNKESFIKILFND